MPPMVKNHCFSSATGSGRSSQTTVGIPSCTDEAIKWRVPRMDIFLDLFSYFASLHLNDCWLWLNKNNWVSRVVILCECNYPLTSIRFWFSSAVLDVTWGAEGQSETAAHKEAGNTPRATCCNTFWGDASLLPSESCVDDTTGASRGPSDFCLTPALANGGPSDVVAALSIIRNSSTERLRWGVMAAAWWLKGNRRLMVKRLGDSQCSDETMTEADDI